MPGYLFVGLMIAIGLLGVAVRNRVPLTVRRVILAVSTTIMAVAAFADPTNRSARLLAVLFGISFLLGTRRSTVPS